MAKPKSKLCAYCGNNLATTRDHVIPKCLFVQPLPMNMITVPCCEPCNNDLSKHEDYIRDMLTVDIRTYQNPTAQAVFNGSVLRSAGYGSSDIARSATFNSSPARLFTESGIYVEDGVAIPLDVSRYTLVFEMMIRGLYYYHFHQTLPEKYKVKVNQMSIGSVKNLVASLPSCSGPYNLGDVFSYLYVYAEEDQAWSSWYLAFYNSIIVTGLTHPDTFDPTLPGLADWKENNSNG